MTVKEKISELHAKFYGKKSTVEIVNNKLAAAGLAINFVSNKDNKPSPKEGIRMAAGTTCAELRQVCKEKGIKNFGVLDKAEMEDILAHIGDQEHINKVVAKAVAEWKGGWGKKAREAGKDHKE